MEKEILNTQNLAIRSYAHIGDAVYELYIREKTVFLTSNSERLHKKTIMLVNAEYQAMLLDHLQDFVNEEEKDIIRRARNLAVTTARRTNHKVHRLSTAFEALIGYLYLNNRERLTQLYEFIDSTVEEKLKASSDLKS